ncbi:MAG: 30S ribosomal protein S5 [Candidatus Thermoplasmatota archaeon]|nr:30S ribosomal protein S5 [Candidatus Thermoplasmatota archaeon]
MNGWEPKTRLGRKVKRGEITSMEDALSTRLPIKEPEIIDALLPDLDDDVLDVNMVQRMTDSGRRVRFTVTTVVGNNDGYVGVATAKGKEVGPTIRKCMETAKLNIVRIRRGCGSWECGCGDPHTVPFEVEGKTGSVYIRMIPAPSGIGLAVGDTAKSILKRAGIEDMWGFSKGKTRTTVNYALAVFDALKETSKMRVRKDQAEDLGIIAGIHKEEEEISEKEG